MDDIVRELIEFVKTASPQLWAILIKQVYVEAIGSLIYGLLLIIPSVALPKWMSKLDMDYSGDEELVKVIGWIVVGVSVISSILFITGALKWILNPEFQAINFVLGSMSGGGCG